MMKRRANKGLDSFLFPPLEKTFFKISNICAFHPWKSFVPCSPIHWHVTILNAEALMAGQVIGLLR